MVPSRFCSRYRPPLRTYGRLLPTIAITLFRAKPGHDGPLPVDVDACMGVFATFDRMYQRAYP